MTDQTDNRVEHGSEAQRRRADHVDRGQRRTNSGPRFEDYSSGIHAIPISRLLIH